MELVYTFTSSYNEFICNMTQCRGKNYFRFTRLRLPNANTIDVCDGCLQHQMITHQHVYWCFRCEMDMLEVYSLEYLRKYHPKIALMHMLTKL